MFWRFVSEAEQARTEKRVDAAVALAGPVEYVIAVTSLLAPPIAIRRVTPEEMATIREWLPYLGIAA
jgi:hypothetical protein